MITVQSGTLVGVEALEVTVEVDLLRRLPAMVVTGLPALSVRESADRVRSALCSSSYEFPKQRVVISLSPADLRKDGTGFDLPIAVGILAATGRVPEERAKEYLMVGELSLSGELRPVRGVLAYAELARRLGMKGIVVPARNWPEASLVPGLDAIAAGTLENVVDFFCEGVRPATPASVASPAFGPALDMKDIMGQQVGRRALEIAAAGGHNLLMTGPPGCGKSMLASRLPSILPPLTPAEALECTRIQSAAGLRSPDGGPASSRPFRAPHFSISASGLVGGFPTGRLGEVSLAHRGVLFLDEVTEFPKRVLELLEWPLREGSYSTNGYATSVVVLPARFQLVAAMSPCPCGFLGHPTRPCVCPDDLRGRYAQRQAGALNRHFDLRVVLEAGDVKGMYHPGDGESSAIVRERVVAARKRQFERQGCLNGQLEGTPTLTRVLMTIADLAGGAATPEHLIEAEKLTEGRKDVES